MTNKDNEEWDSIIRSNRSLLDIQLKKLVEYFDLLLLFVKRDLLVVYKQTILGPLWFVIQPIFTMLIYIVVFGNIANIETNDIPKPLFYLSGIVFWNYFSDCFIKTSNTFTDNAEVFGKVYFPRLIMPLSIVISNGFKLVIQLMLFLSIYFYYIYNTGTIPATWAVSTIPLLLIIIAFIGLGFGLIFSSMTTKYKDLKFLIQFGVQLLMYATPIIYPMSIITSQKIKLLIWLNPMSHIIEAFKFAFLGAGLFSWLGIFYSFMFGLVVFILGIIIFNRTEQSFMDTV